MSTTDAGSLLFSPEAAENPFPIYTSLREEAPVHAMFDGSARLVTRYDDVLACSRNYEAFSSEIFAGVGPEGARIIIGTDPPDHTNLRRLVTKPFRPGAIGAMEPRVREIAEQLLDDLIMANQRGEADLVTQLAIPLPVIVIAEMLGIPIERREDFRRWSDESLGGGGMGAAPNTGRSEMDAFFAEEIREREKDPGEDLISTLITGAEPLSEAELILFCNTLLVAGNETTRNLISNAMLALFEHPGEAERLWADPSLIASAMEESLRFDGPAPMIVRRATADTEVAGETVPAGTTTMLLLAAANRDPRHFDDPDTFDVTRNPRDHVGFGYGVHLCLGAALARLEARVVFETIITRLRDVRRNGPIERNPNGMLRGLQHLPIAFREDT